MVKIKTIEELTEEIEKCKNAMPEFQERKQEFELKRIANEKASDELMCKILSENREEFEKIKDDYKEVIKLLNRHYSEERKELTLEFMAIQNQIMCLSMIIYEFENQIEKNENKIKSIRLKELKGRTNKDETGKEMEVHMQKLF